jgi:hypothetical protein
MFAQFATLQDQPVTLSPGGNNQVINFNILQVQPIEESAYLSFRVRSNGIATLMVLLNGAEVLEHEFESATERVWQENFRGNLLGQVNNSITLVHRGGDGDVKVSDIVVHYYGLPN